jgi:16S rRNA (uracil1498-N3)-methyltransferase
MRIPRIYVDADLSAGGGIDLPAAAAHHLVRVLRMHEGDPVVLFNGRGGEYAGRISETQNAQVKIAGLEFSPIERESPLQLTLAQGISRGERMDYTLQKAVELGIAEIVPIWMERSTVKSDAVRDAKRGLHWRGIVISACEQCGRNRVPVVHNSMNLLDCFAKPGHGLKLLLHGGESSGLRGLGGEGIATDSTITLLAGPEGGFAPAEIEAAIAAGFRPVRLGPRTLRTETAALAALAAIQALWGDFA